MTRAQWINKRTQELIKQGTDPEKAYSLAYAEFLKKFGVVDEVPKD